MVAGVLIEVAIRDAEGAVTGMDVLGAFRARNVSDRDNLDRRLRLGSAIHMR